MLIGSEWISARHEIFIRNSACLPRSYYHCEQSSWCFLVLENFETAILTCIQFFELNHCVKARLLSSKIYQQKIWKSKNKGEKYFLPEKWLILDLNQPKYILSKSGISQSICQLIIFWLCCWLILRSRPWIRSTFCRRGGGSEKLKNIFMTIMRQLTLCFETENVITFSWKCQAGAHRKHFELVSP